jgi:hypothetical protein
MPGIEERYIHNLDRERNREERTEGKEAEKIVLDLLESAGFETRFATPAEDEGFKDIGRKPMIDAVAYFEGKAVMGIQITTNSSRDMREKKFAEMREKPFIRLDEMNPKDLSIPRVLIYMEPAKVNKYKEKPDFNTNQELALQILDSVIISLKFDLTYTKDPHYQKSVNDLIRMMEDERKKYLH